jgi:glycogen operon protein
VHVASDFDWGSDSPPHIPWRDTIIYEAHVKGQTMLHPDIPPELRGTYAGLAHPAMIEYLTTLGITAVQLLPVHFHIDEPHLQDLGLTNYWGYNTLGYFAPQTSYATAAAQADGPKAVQDEFKEMVRLLHEAGLEVILDVVYNHTAEGGVNRPTLSWRGLAERQYYRHDFHGRYLDTTGCGNTLDFSEPRVVQMALDSLRYWVEEFHVDGFRFDLAVSLARDEANEFSPHHPFLVAAATSGILSGVKLIAEPWDVGMGGWQTGRFPKGWADWNDHFRDSVRDFWLSDQASIAAGGQGGTLSRLADSLTGSAHLFAPSGRTPLASINLVTAHDGFTLADLVSYDRKHNEDNGEENRDGHNDNRSYNHGVEGPTEDEAILRARAQTARNIMVTLMMSRGVPMIGAGDELGRSQHGNNNAYCQDNELSWLDWSMGPAAYDMLRSTRRIIRMRRDFLAPHQPAGDPVQEGFAQLHWFDKEGLPMTPEQWHDPANRVLQFGLGSPEGIVDGLVVINAGPRDEKVVLPFIKDAHDDDGAVHESFELRLATSAGNVQPHGTVTRSGEKVLIQAKSINIYRVPRRLGVDDQSQFRFGGQGLVER